MDAGILFKNVGDVSEGVQGFQNSSFHTEDVKTYALVYCRTSRYEKMICCTVHPTLTVHFFLQEIG